MVKYVLYGSSVCVWCMCLKPWGVGNKSNELHHQQIFDLVRKKKKKEKKIQGINLSIDQIRYIFFCLWKALMQ